MKEAVIKSSTTDTSLKSKQNILVKQIDLLLSKNKTAVYKDIQVGELVYLMSEKWLIRVKQSLRLNQTLTEQPDAAINAELIQQLDSSSYTYYDHHLKQHITQQNQDPNTKIRVLSRQQYVNITKALPQTRIIRLQRRVIKVKGQKQLQLHPYRVDIDIVSMKKIMEAQQISNKKQIEFADALDFAKIKVNIYSNQTIPQLISRIRKNLFDQDKQMRIYAYQPNIFKHVSFSRMIEYFYKRQNTKFKQNEHQKLFQTLQQKQNTLQTSRILQFFPGKLLQNERVNDLKQKNVQKLILQVRQDQWTFPHQPQYSIVKNCKYCMMKSQLYIDFYCQKQDYSFLFCSKLCHYLFVISHSCEGSKEEIIQKYGQQYLPSTKAQSKTQQRTDFTNKSTQSQVQLDKKSVIEYIRSDINDLAIVKSNKSPLVHTNIGGYMGGGMNNLGNTCYLNASLQILIRTKLTEILIGIQKTIETNKKCRLSKAYLNLIRQLRALGPNESLGFHTMQMFKVAVEQALDQFRGYAQHDVHEFILFFLDKLSDELNLNEKTPPFQLQINREKQLDEALGRKQWLHLIQKNNSPIINLFYGQTKSQIDCPHCHTSNKKFDTFSVLSISIPETINNTIQLYYESYLFKEKIKYLKFDNGPGSTVDDAIKGTMARLGFPEEKAELMGVFLLGHEGQCPEVDKSKKISELLPQMGKFGQKQDQLFVIQKPTRQASMILFKFLYEERPFTFKKPLYFLQDKNKLRNFRIYNIVSLYLVNIAALYLPQHIKPDDMKKVLQLQPQKYFKLRLVYTKKDNPTGEKTKIWIQPDTQIQKELITQKVQIEVLIQKFDNPLQKKDRDTIFFEIVLRKLNKFVKASMKTVLDLKQTPQILQDCLREQFNKKELLANGNEWFCATCKQKRRVHQTTHLYKTNRYLLIHIKRFKKGSDGNFYKNYNKVKLPLQLDLTPILNNHTLPSSYYTSLTDEQLNTYHLTKETNLAPCSKYNLMGLILHEGKLGSGHYTALFRGQDWIQYNDLRISKVKIGETLKQPKTMERAYILLYERAL